MSSKVFKSFSLTTAIPKLTSLKNFQICFPMKISPDKRKIGEGEASEQATASKQASSPNLSNLTWQEVGWWPEQGIREPQLLRSQVSKWDRSIRMTKVRCQLFLRDYLGIFKLPRQVWKWHEIQFWARLRTYICGQIDDDLDFIEGWRKPRQLCFQLKCLFKISIIHLKRNSSLKHRKNCKTVLTGQRKS